MNRLFTLSILLLLSVQTLLAGDLVVRSEIGTPFFLEIDGRIYNHQPGIEVVARDLSAPYHDLRVLLLGEGQEIGLVVEARHVSTPMHLRTIMAVRPTRRSDMALDLVGTEPLQQARPRQLRYDDPYTHDYDPRDRPFPKGNIRPMSEIELAEVERVVLGQPFESNRMNVAQQALSHRYLSTQQVRRLLEAFSFESNRLDLAKYCYERVVDPENYFRINEAFRFSSSVRDLGQYIQTHPHPLLAAQPPMPSPRNPRTPRRPYTYQDCQQPMHAMHLDAALMEMRRQPYESSKMNIVRQVLQTNCVTSIQLQTMLRELAFDSNRLTIAQEAYPLVWDPQNYFQVNAAFQYPSTVRKLNQFLVAQAY